MRGHQSQLQKSSIQICLGLNCIDPLLEKPYGYLRFGDRSADNIILVINAPKGSLVWTVYTYEPSFVLKKKKRNSENKNTVSFKKNQPPLLQINSFLNSNIEIMAHFSLIHLRHLKLINTVIYITLMKTNKKSIRQ